MKKLQYKYGLQIKLTFMSSICVVLGIFFTQYIIFDQFSTLNQNRIQKMGETLSISIGTIAKQSLLLNDKKLINDVIAIFKKPDNKIETGLIHISVIRKDNFTFFASSNKEHLNMKISSPLKDIIQNIPDNSTHHELLKRKIDESKPRLVIQFLRNISTEVGGKPMSIGTVELLFDVEKVNSHTVFITRIAIFLGMFFLLLSSFIAFFYSNIISQKLFLIISAINEISKGKLKIKLTLPGGDVLGSLSSAFNIMVSELRTRKLAMDVPEPQPEEKAPNFSKKIDRHITQEEKVYLITEIKGPDGKDWQKAPEETVKILNRYIEAQVNIIETHKGQIDKIIGDEIRAVFNNKESVDNSILAAREICTRIKELRKEFDSKKDIAGIGIGIHKGIILSGIIHDTNDQSSKEHFSVGAAVKMAKILSSIAKKDEILITSNSMINVSGKYPYKTLTPLKMRGTSEQINILAIYADQPNTEKINASTDTEQEPFLPVDTSVLSETKPVRLEDTMDMYTQSESDFLSSVDDTETVDSYNETNKNTSEEKVSTNSVLSDMLEETINSPSVKNSVSMFSKSSKSLIEEYEEGILAVDSQPEANEQHQSEQEAQETEHSDEKSTDIAKETKQNPSYGNSRLELLASLRKKEKAP